MSFGAKAEEQQEVLHLGKFYVWGELACGSLSLVRVVEVYMKSKRNQANSWKEKPRRITQWNHSQRRKSENDWEKGDEESVVLGYTSLWLLWRTILRPERVKMTGIKWHKNNRFIGIQAIVCPAVRLTLSWLLQAGKNTEFGSLWIFHKWSPGRSQLPFGRLEHGARWSFQVLPTTPARDPNGTEDIHSLTI